MWIAYALGHKACRDGRSVIYHRVPRLFEALAIAKGDGRHARLLKAIAKTEVLSLGDWRLSVLTAMQRRDMLEILEDRHGGDPPSSPADSPSSTGTRPWATRLSGRRHPRPANPQRRPPCAFR
jgi:hypothetical protein